MSGASRKKEQPLVRIDSADKAILDQLVAKTGESTPRLLHKAVGALKKQIFFEQMNDAYKGLREDQAAWAAETAERALFDNAVADGMDIKRSAKPGKK